MIRAHSGCFLHPDSLHPLTSSASLSHIELDTTKSPLALLAQTCLQIGTSQPFSSADSSNNSKDSGGLTISDINSIYSKSVQKKESESSTGGRCVLWTQSATCRPFAVSSPKVQDEEEKYDKDGNKSLQETIEISELYGKTKRDPETSAAPAAFSTSSSLGLSISPLPAVPPPLLAQPVLPTLNNKLCGDPFCLSYRCTTSPKPMFPLLYPPHLFPPSSTSAFTIFPPGFMHPHDLQSSLFSSDNTLFSSAVSRTPMTPTLRNPHYTHGLSARFHPYFKMPFSTPSNSYYSLHGLSLHGQRLHMAP